MSKLANRGMTSDNFPLSYRVKSALSSPTSYDVPLPKVVTELVGEGQQVLVEGPPGTGKTFVGMHVAEQLKSLGTYKFVICLDIEKASKEVLDSEERLVKFSVRERLITLDQEHTFLEALKNEPNSIAFIFDHLEQLSTTSENAYLKQLICGYTVPGGRLLLSRYPYPEIGSSSVHVVLKGFDSVTTACLFVQEKLKVTHKINRTQPLEQYIQVHPIIGEVCIIPRMAEILVRVYARDNRCIKDTETLLLHRMIVEWIKLRLPRLTVDSLYKLPAEQKVHLLHFAQIAFCSLELNTDTDGAVSLAASEISCVNLQKGFPSLDAVNNFGLVQCSGNTIYGFLHPTIHAFLAAFYLSCLPQDEQIAFYYDKFPKNVTQFLNVAMFHFGLTRLEAEEFLDPSKVVLAGMIESLAHVMEKQEKLTPDLYLELQKLIQACLFEAQDPTLVKNFSQQYLKLMQLKFTNDKALDDLRLTAHLEYVIVNSEIDLWEIDIPDEKFHRKTDTLVFPILSTVTDRFIKVDVKVRPGQSAIFILKPIFEAKPPQRTGRATEMIKRARNEEEKEMYFQLAMVCTGQRETLHRVTQLYSPVPMKSDAGDPAYASLITCGCVEQKLREEVLFEPIHPIHTVQLSSKSRKTKGPDGERDATTRKHVEEAHKNNYLEIIVLNKPSVKSITFQPPGAIQPCRLVMSTEKLPSSMSGRIAMEVEKSVTDQAKFELGGKTMEMVTHGLPLPKSKNRIRVNVQQAKETTGYRERDVTTRKPVPVKSDAAAYASPIIDDPVFEEIQLRHENDSGTNLHPPVPTSHSEFAEEERIIHYHNSAEGQSVAYFEATLTRPNLEETQNPLIVFLCSSVPPRLSPQSSPNSSPPTSSQVGGDIFRSPYDSAVSSQLDDSSSYSSSLSDTSAGIEEAQQSVNGNNEPIFPPLRVQYLPSSMSGRIAMEVEKSVTDQEKFVECMYMTESGGPLKEMMTHGLPLPKRKSKIDAERANVEQAEETAGVRLSAAQVAPSHKHFQEGAVGPYDAIPVQPEAIEKVTWRPGMIMFTTIPDVFEKHRSYSLPVEDHQIRRGGNGEIFSADYKGYTLVAKKTLFCSREYNIIIGLKHENIIPLLALMVGEVSHRRRFFCYHMLPRMSGDVARMLSDHPELTLAALKQTYADDPRQFGLALGNMRYLLAEVLKGLAYLHNLHIVHRDVKASNILVRFHCQHDNLLWCTCQHKYTVRVCDFDAAVELGTENELLPVSQTSQAFYLPPVGTQGFRSPEGSQLIVASNPDVIVPRLTPRSDVWSFGVLILRLFLGVDGPSSQREVVIEHLMASYFDN